MTEEKTEFMNVKEKNFKIKTFELEERFDIHKSYQFNVGFAQKYGVNEAIILQNLIFWIEKNKVNKKNQHDNYYWTYNTIEAFNKLFPFWTERQIRYILKSLENKGIIKKGNYNKYKYDRTGWYTIIDTSILQFCQLRATDMSIETDENVTTIPDINTDNKPDNNIGKPLRKNSNLDSHKSNPNERLEDAPPSSLYNILKEIIDYLNLKANKKYRYDNKKTNEYIKARLNNNYTVKDFKTVIDIKCSQWLKDVNYSKYLRPETLFGTKFEGYLNENTPNIPPPKEYYHDTEPAKMSAVLVEGGWVGA